MDELILIPCSCKKGSPPEYDESVQNGRSFLEDLNEDYEKDLDELQKKVAESFNIRLNDDRANGTPSYMMYSGKLYSQLDSELWRKLKNDDNKEMCIITPLYGVIYWDEHIVDYNVSMEDNINDNRLNTWWKHKNLSDFLTHYIEKNGFELVRSLLPVSHKKSMPFIQYEIDIDWLQYDYPALRSGSNYYRGWDLMRILDDVDIVCPECGSRKTKRISKEYFGCIECGTIYEIE